MPIKFRRAGFYAGPARVRAYTSEPGSAPSDVLDPENWQLDVHDLSLGWTSPLMGECILDIRQEEGCAQPAYIEFNFNHLGGDYRLCVTSADVDDDFDTVFFRQASSEREPLYVCIEGLDLNGGHIAPMGHLAQTAIPNSLSQEVDQRDGISVSGGIEIDLVDIDGALTEAFQPRSAPDLKTSTMEGLDKTETEIMVVSTSGFPESGIIYIENEAIRYTGVSGGTTFTGCTRGHLGTTAAVHLLGAPVFSVNPYWKGRHVWLKKAAGGGYGDTDPVLFAGVIDSLSPAADNLACYRLRLSDTLVCLNGKVGRWMGRGQVLKHLMIHSEEQESGRYGNDTLYLRHTSDIVAGWNYIEIRLPHGPYMSDRYSLGHPLNIATALQKAIDEAAPGLPGSFAIDEDGKLVMNFNVRAYLQLLPSYGASGNRDSMLESLGFEEKASDIFENPVGAGDPSGASRLRVEVLGGKAIANGVGSTNTRVFLEAPEFGGGGARSFSMGNLARVGDEIFYYGGVSWVSSLAIPTDTTSQSRSDEDTSIQLDDASDFPENGGAVRINDEIIFYEKIPDGRTLVNCHRGAWGTVAASHNSGSNVKAIVLESLKQCVRGIYGAKPAAHEGGGLIEEIWTSDDLIRLNAEQVARTPSAPVDFLLDLLDGSRSSSPYGLRLPEGAINEDSFERTSSEVAVNYDGSFHRLVRAEETYREVIADICRSTAMQLYVDGSGRIALGRFRPKLRHEEADADIDHDNLVDAPKIEWREDLRINRVEADLDYDPISEEFGTLVVIDDDREMLRFAFNSEDHTLNIESRCIYTSLYRSYDGSGEGWYYDLAWSIIRHYNRFLTRLSVEVLPSAAENLGLFSRVGFSSSVVPWGNGERGVSDTIFDVVEMENDVSRHRVRLGLLERSDDMYGGFAPSAKLSAWSAGSVCATIEKNYYWPPDLKPSDLFQSGDKLCMKDMSALSAGTYTEAAALTIANDGVDDSNWESSGEADITFTSPPGFTPAAGDILVPSSYDNHVPPPTILDLFVYLADDNETLGAAEDEAYMYSF